MKRLTEKEPSKPPRVVWVVCRGEVVEPIHAFGTHAKAKQFTACFSVEFTIHRYALSSPAARNRRSKKT